MISSFALPDGFGLWIDTATGQIRRQIAPGRFEREQFEVLAEVYMGRTAARKLLARFRWVRPDASEVPAYRVVRCGIAVLKQEAGVQVYRALASARAHFGGIVQCGSVWHCPVCARKIAARRRAELEAATGRAVDSGGVVGLLTLTVPHAASEACKEVLQRLQRLFHRLSTGKASAKFRDRFHVAGQVRAVEFTVGMNGWHPHIHSLVFCERPVDWEVVGEALFCRWQAAARNEFGWTLPRVSLDLRGGEAAGQYVGKWGVEGELAGGVLKSARHGSRTPFGLLRDFSDPELDRPSRMEAGEKFVGFATAVSRMEDGRINSTRQLVWSRGLKARYGIAELSDEDIAEQHEEPAVLLGCLSYTQWLRVVRQPYDARIVLLSLASLGTWDEVCRFVESLPASSGEAAI